MNKKIFAVVLLGALLTGIMVAWALTTWTGTITWQITEEEEFSVWGSIDGTDELGQPWTVDLGLDPIGYTKDFYLQNDGNVEITVAVTSTPIGLCSAEWTDAMGNPTTSWQILEGSTRVQATLTLTISGDGGYSFEFNIV